ncbi:hypothetical protein B0T25DRAFT_565562 [Lasiosphaeria hispida]|uniref:Uncharacterized protein n=1 Tax=Lasiosphaeria hispida TaxID=260671 RepID=A0AAJ0MIV4_9PEZI|nr:hypothetical protein B0T25DRAFT_565562 [Lasiosphaeria hispida]
MFGRNAEVNEDSRGLLSHENMGNEEVIWEHEQNSIRMSDRNTATPPELWDQDPLSDGDGNLRGPSNRASSSSKVAMLPPTPEDNAEATTELDAEFQRIFSPVKKDQQEKARFHYDLDTACAAYSSRLGGMRDQQREREAAIEVPWLAARRRRDWQRIVTMLRVAGVVLTCFCGGSVAHLDEVPPRIPWPPPHLIRIKEDHAEERKALREAHLAVVRELRVKYGLHGGEEDGDAGEQQGGEEDHVCAERKLLNEVLGKTPVPGEGFAE